MLYGFTMHSERPRHRMYEQWHPHGVVGVISAFNFPVAVWSWNFAIALVCGPPIMIRFTVPALQELGFAKEDIILSLENRMKCGIGMCGSCTVLVDGEPRRSCLLPVAVVDGAAVTKVEQVFVNSAPRQLEAGEARVDPRER